MLYRKYGNTNKLISAIGFGSTRFSPSDLNDNLGLDRCAQLVLAASEQGVNYFDTAYNYSKSQCENIFKRAFKLLKKPFYVASKSSSFQDKTASDVLRRIESSLKNMGLEKFDFYHMWSIMNENHYNDIMRKGGPYDGVIQAKEQGLIDHIAFSSHATPETAVKIINDNVFEGILLSYSLLNYSSMNKVIKSAAKQNMGITVMNPLAGGLIPQNPSMFNSIMQDNDKSLAQAAFRFIYSHPEITCILSGISSLNEVYENTSSLLDDSSIGNSRIEAVSCNINQISGLCTGCGYCNNCPVQIPIPQYMQAYNMSLFYAQSLYGKTDRALLQRISVFRKLILDFDKQPFNSENPCVGCMKCEKVCTQHLPIRERICDLLKWSELSSCSKSHYKYRLNTLLNEKTYTHVGFYTAGGYTATVLKYFKEFFGEPNFKISIFDSNSTRWGDTLDGYKIYNPQYILELQPECIIISNYIYGDEIYKNLEHYIDNGIEIKKLHTENDTPWVY